MDKLNALKKAVPAALIAAAALSGCAVVPAEAVYAPGPVYAAPAPVYVAPAATVVIRPYARYGYYRGSRWRHWR
jgi:hypothetical protein